MIRILCVGKIKENYLNELIDDYLKRISKYHKIEIVEVKDSDIIHEKDLLMKYIDRKDYNIALTLSGKKYDSVSLSNHINEIFNHNSSITFIIGGSNGIHEDVISECNVEVSFSDLTFPHGLFRGILLEQIYRSFKIMNNESYHK